MAAGRRSTVAAVVVMILLLGLAGCTGRDAPAGCPQQTLGRLSLPERVGQLFMGAVQVDRSPASVPPALGEARVGSILLLGNSTGGAAEIATAVERAQAMAGSPGGARPLVAADQEGGQVQRLAGPGFSQISSAVEQGRLTPDQLRRDAQAWGAELASVGVNLNLAPVADVVPEWMASANEPIGGLHRGYGSDPELVSGQVVAFVQGMNRAGVATAVKHFPGLGRVHGNTDFSRGVVDWLTTRQDPGLAPFRAGVAAGAEFLMLSLATYRRIDPDHRAVFSSTVIQRMVREDLGFSGVVVSDDLGAAEEVSELPPAQRAIDFLAAGGDLVIAVDSAALTAMTRAVVARAESDSGFRAALDTHARRVLTAKHRLGLLSCDG